MKTWTKLLLLSLFALLAAAASLFLGAAGDLAALDWATAWKILRFARLPRTAATLLAGAALAVSGCIIQGVLGNSLASPGIIGVNAGAGLAVTALCAAGVLSGWAIAAGAFGGALGAALLVTFTAQKLGASRSTVILGGVAVNSFLNALSQAITDLVPEAAALSVDFRVGGFSSVSELRLVPASVLIVVSLLFVMTLGNDLELMTLGEDTAQGLGMPIKRMRTLLLSLAALLAGAAVSFAGLLGFVGLIVPHMTRRLLGKDRSCLLPATALLGAGFVTACDLAARLVAAPYELSAGVLLSVLGGPFFLWLLIKGGHRHG